MQTAMSAVAALALGLGLAVAPAAGFADTSSAHATGPNSSAAAAAASSGTNGKPCQVVRKNHDGNGVSTSVNTGAGGLSGTATAGPNGPSVTINPGAGNPGAGNGSVAVGTAQAGNGRVYTEANGNCVVVLPAQPGQGEGDSNH